MADFFSTSLGIAALVVIVLVVIYFLVPKSKVSEALEADQDTTHSEQVAVSKINTEVERKHEEDFELVAAIMAGLSAYLEVPASKLKINSIRRVDGNISSWRKAGL